MMNIIQKYAQARSMEPAMVKIIHWPSGTTIDRRYNAPKLAEFDGSMVYVDWPCIGFAKIAWAEPIEDLSIVHQIKHHEKGKAPMMIGNFNIDALIVHWMRSPTWKVTNSNAIKQDDDTSTRLVPPFS